MGTVFSDMESMLTFLPKPLDRVALLGGWGVAAYAVFDSIPRFRRADSDALFAHFDSDGNGDVDAEEIVKAIASIKQVAESKVNKKMISKVWDADGDGKITKEEFFTRMQRMKKDKPEMFAHFMKWGEEQ